MKTVGLNDITQDGFDRAAATVIDFLRTGYPKIDLRKGTVLRDLVVNPDATLAAVGAEQVEECRKSTSLKALSDRSEAGEEIDMDDVSAILSNFNMAPVEGTKARGHVRMMVSRDVTYTVMKGTKFSTIDGIEFETTSTVTASSSGSGDAALSKGSQNWWFLVPVECLSVGVAGNIQQGTALEFSVSLQWLVSCAAYETFSGGSDLESLTRTVSRIKSSLSMRGLTSCPAVESVLRDYLDDGDNPVVAVSVCGYGNPAQLRDRHNLFGVGVGGRADVYVRNFSDIPTEAVTKEAVDAGGGLYTVDVSADEIPGMYCVYRVSDPDTNALSSYEHSEEWIPAGVDGTWHDIDVSDGPDEVAGSVWRSVRITVKGYVPPEDGEPKLRVEFVRLPEAAGLQRLVDDGSVRNVGADFVVRCPVVVQMSIVATVRHPASVAFDKELAAARLCEYVNNSGFVGRITRSEVSSILIGMGARSVDLFDESKMLYGFGYDSAGRLFEMSGDALDVANVADPRRMVTKDTCVFVLEPSRVQINTVQVGV